MPAPLDIRSIIDETNQTLVKDFNIDPNDPIVANIILNQVVLGHYVDEINQTLDIHHKRLLKALETEEESARRIASKVITQSTDYLSEKIRIAGCDLRSRLASTVKDDLGVNPTLVFRNWSFGVLGLGVGMVIGLFF